MQDPNVRTQTITLFGRLYIYDQSKISRQKLTEIISDVNRHDWKDKKNKEFAINTVAKLLI